MILERIIIDNFGVYEGRQQIDLLPSSKRKPIILIGGMNGGGKTTLLDAFQLVLYGRNARCSGKGKRNYLPYLRSMINRSADASEGASIELHFNRSIEGRIHRYKLRRFWREATKGMEEHVQVTRDDEPDQFLSEHWNEHIEGYLPNGIAHLFFFDAEQIKDLADGEHAAEILGTAINTLLGLDIVDRLDTDLTVLEKRRRKEVQSKEESAQIAAAERDVEYHQQLADESTTMRDGVAEELRVLSKELQSLQSEFDKQGGQKFLNRKEVEDQREEFGGRLRVAENQLRQIAAGPSPMLLIGDLISRTKEQASKEAETHRAEILVESLAKRDADLLKRLKTKKVPTKHLSIIEVDLKRDRDKQDRLANRECHLNGTDHLPHELKHLQTAVLPHIREQVAEQMEKIRQLQSRIDELDRELAQVPDADAIAKIQRALERKAVEVKRKQTDLDAADEKISLFYRKIDDAKRKLSKLLGQDLDLQGKQEHFSRLLDHSKRARATLGKFRSAVMKFHAERLERLVLESFTQLLRKSDLVTGLKIDPLSFRIQLTGGDGKPLPFDRLSAGERQLLATSILWGLARASGRPLPTIIDTPLGRLDSSHRKHLVQRYFPVASHQVILLSTDEEIDETNFKRLKPTVGRTYNLRFDEKARATRVDAGYFWNK